MTNKPDETLIETNEEFAETFKGYSTFTEIDNPILRAFNQWNILSTMTQNGLDAIGLEYIAQLPREHQFSLAEMCQYIKKHGLEETKRSIFYANNKKAA